MIETDIRELNERNERYDVARFSFDNHLLD